MQWLFTLPQEDESDSWGKNAIMNKFWERYLLSKNSKHPIAKNFCLSMISPSSNCFHE
jgi:hypothetical protein